MRRSAYYDRILLALAASNAPYLTVRGRCVLVVLGGCLACCVAAYYHEMRDMASLLALAAVTVIFLMAVSYTKCLIVWKGVEKGQIRGEIQLPAGKVYLQEKMRLNSVFANDLPWTVRIEAVRISHTKRVGLKQPEDIGRELSGGGSLTIEVELEGRSVGRGRLTGLGVALTDSNELFRSECHICVNNEIAVLPSYRIHRRRSRDELVQALQAKRAQNQNDEENIDRIRPWLNGDSLRRIHWRGYARRQELSVIEMQKTSEHSAVFFIDSGAYMRIRRADQSCCLCDCLIDLVRIAGCYERLNIVVYDESGAEVIARNLGPEACIKRYIDWLLGVLEWRPDPGINQAEAWGEAAIQLYQDFKLYHQVDFIKQSESGARIDLKGLVTWAEADLASKALERGDAAEASRLLKVPYGTMLLDLIHARCELEDDRLPPVVKNPNLAAGEKVLGLLLRRQKIDSVIWFSEFAGELDDGALVRLKRTLRVSGASCFIRCCQMPRHCLNFNPRDGEMMRGINIEKIGKSAKLLREL